MLGFVASLVFATAAVLSIATIVASWHGQAGAIKRLLRDSQRLAFQRDFDVRIVATGRKSNVLAPAPLRAASAVARRPFSERAVSLRSEPQGDVRRHAAA
ncbi:hypothetical protein [Novosphingobium lentum]|uniref:hypothetical protein n=1 Tax=Novosphingobium lentum TaxID=145287 RepID=UPI00082F7FE4|nr:hypothetical protein [Novosphingobium lentum]